MIGRYVLATAAVVLLVVGLLLGAVVYLGLHYGEAADSRVRIGTLAEALIPTADGLQLDPARTPADWLQGYAWAMVLDDDGSVIWQHDLPQNLNKHYTASEIASFSRWYLDDWPVFCWTADYGLFVAAMPRGSVWRCNIYNNAQLMNAMAAGMLPALALLLGVPAACCLLYGAQPLRCQPTQAGPLLRRLAAEFCDSPLAASCTVALEIAPDADKAILDADAALLARAVENLLHNAACHNPGPVQVQLSAVRTGKTLRITIADDGAGYPPAVLHALQTGEAGENTPHILGLHVVEQIIHAHGGTAAFARNAPRGAKAVLVLPVTEDPAAR